MPAEEQDSVAHLRVIARPDHPVSRRNISPSALKVISRLNKSGHESYLVGGAVRDMFLGNHPKDFDVATDATPEEVRALFKNSRIIGRRFRIVHVRFGREVIEVTTFRGHHGDNTLPQKVSRHDDVNAAKSESGMLLRDNVYGDLEDDALRRDFTINALYYDLRDFSVLDYTGGARDLEQRQIKVIGDPEQRFREDPVRMLRAARFAAKLDFVIPEDLAGLIAELAYLIGNVPAARMFDETLKLFMSGYATAAFDCLLRYSLLDVVCPSLARLIPEYPRAQKLVHLAMESTDRRIAAEKPVTPAFIYAALLWPQVQELERVYRKDGMPPTEALQKAADQALAEQIQATTIPKRFSLVVRDIWSLQLRLPKTQGRRPRQLLEHRRFRAAYDFLLLREESGENLNGLGKWWTRFQEENPVSPAPEHPPRRRRPRRRKPQQA